MARKPDNISQEDWDAVDSPPLTQRMLRGMRPAREVLRPALFEKLTKVRGPQKSPTKEAVSLRLDRDVLDHFRAKGEGWQTKINEVLRESARADAGTSSKAPPKKTVARSSVTGEFTTTAAANKTPKRVATLASAGLKNPATLSRKDIKSISAGALTQSSGLSPATRRDKKRSK